MISRWNKIRRFDKQEITLNYVSLGESGPLFKKLIDSGGLTFAWQLENVMKRVTLGEPKQSAIIGGFRLAQNPRGTRSSGFCSFGLYSLPFAASDLTFPILLGCT
jgi:hypothetical protein